MTTPNPQIPAAFTNDDFAARMRRVVSAAVERALAGVIVTPGPDLVWLTGYHPTSITERDLVQRNVALLCEAPKGTSDAGQSR